MMATAVGPAAAPAPAYTRGAVAGDPSRHRSTTARRQRASTSTSTSTRAWTCPNQPPSNLSHTPPHTTHYTLAFLKHAADPEQPLDVVRGPCRRAYLLHGTDAPASAPSPAAAAAADHQCGESLPVHRRRQHAQRRGTSSVHVVYHIKKGHMATATLERSRSGTRLAPRLPPNRRQRPCWPPPSPLPPPSPTPHWRHAAGVATLRSRKGAGSEPNRPALLAPPVPPSQCRSLERRPARRLSRSSTTTASRQQPLVRSTGHAHATSNLACRIAPTRGGEPTPHLSAVPRARCTAPPPPTPRRGDPPTTPPS